MIAVRDPANDNRHSCNAAFSRVLLDVMRERRRLVGGPALDLYEALGPRETMIRHVAMMALRVEAFDRSAFKKTETNHASA